MPPNFQNGKIYAIRSHQTDKVYIGSTTQSLSVRFGEHKRKTCTSREIMKFEDCYIELLEEFPCVNKMQLNKREGELIRIMDCTNKNIAGRTLLEYRNEHKNEKKQYYQNNKEHIREQRNQKYNCFCTGKYTRCGKSHHFKSKKHLEFMRTLETTTA